MTAELRKWKETYQLAILELEQVKMAGRISDAHNAITERLAVLQEIPGLHREERQAIQDALNGLRVLENEQAKYEAEEKRRIADRVITDLRRVAPRFAD